MNNKYDPPLIFDMREEAILFVLGVSQYTVQTD